MPSLLWLEKLKSVFLVSPIGISIQYVSTMEVSSTDWKGECMSMRRIFRMHFAYVNPVLAMVVGRIKF